ncbi:MAG: zinc ribbon domain-containing protein [Deltaproteobacteria bacterium]|nr:zinc ribbon domain-containing protein [Deltaproteobacteria bacterium]
MNCPHCERPNREHRRFCAACGASLVATCPACEFINDAPDQFCGGCGTVLAASQVLLAPTDSGVTMLSAAEVAALLTEVPALPSASTALPRGPIGQDDLDRLFGRAE